jgi:hypothetical protein
MTFFRIHLSSTETDAERFAPRRSAWSRLRDVHDGAPASRASQYRIKSIL